MRQGLLCIFSAVDGRADEVGTISRVPAAEIEALAVQSVREHLNVPQTVADRDLIGTHVTRIEVHSREIVIQLSAERAGDGDGQSPPAIIRVPWQKQPSKRARQILLPASEGPIDTRPIRSETRATLIAAIARGRRWLNELITDPEATAETIAQRESCSARKVNMTISLAFLSPALVKAALEGPRGLGVTRLSDMPAEWSRQHAALGVIP